MLINLHTHLEGRVRPATAFELARTLKLPGADRDWEHALQLDAPADLTVYLEKVSSTYPFFADYESLARIAREAVEDAAADGQNYLELRFGPATHVSPKLSLDDVIAAVCEGVSQGTKNSGMPAGVVVAALRLHGAERNEQVATASARFAGRGVVGFDLAGDELRFPDLEPYVNAFAIARAAGLGLTCHAAEAAPAHAALDAVDLFGVTRIGHGAHLADDPSALRRIADQGIYIEICPTSNLYTGAISTRRQHPAPEFREAGVALVLGDDNPRQTQSPLSAERAVLRDELGFDAVALDRLDADSVEAAFVDDSVRALWRSRLLSPR
ncbi:adenosine deaminase [Microbacterium sp. LWO13-1.2]|uniref:adenosine deaminase n=1 Tax=Microbacterium sp. LWO13-1.2 TaxID=3135262 RepID=UPI00313A0AFF